MTTGRGDPGLQGTTETEEGDGRRGEALGFHRLPVMTTARLPPPEQGTECHHPEKVLQQQQEILGPCDLASSKDNMKDSCQFHRLSGPQRGTSWVLAPAISARRKASYLFGFYYYYFHYFMGLET